MRILVIGGTGTVGRHIVRDLSERGAEVAVMTRDPGSKPVLDDGAEYVSGELEDRESVVRAMAGASAVYLLTPVHQEEAQLGRNAVLAASDAQTGFPIGSPGRGRAGRSTFQVEAGYRGRTGPERPRLDDRRAQQLLPERLQFPVHHVVTEHLPTATRAGRREPRRLHRRGTRGRRMPPGKRPLRQDVRRGGAGRA